jgi:hypothetical protein
VLAARHSPRGSHPDFHISPPPGLITLKHCA